MQPQLQRLKDDARIDPRRYAERLAALYRENGIELMAAIQTSAMHYVLARRIKSGKVVI